MTEWVNDRCNKEQKIQSAEYENSNNWIIPEDNLIKNTLYLEYIYQEKGTVKTFSTKFLILYKLKVVKQKISEPGINLPDAYCEMSKNTAGFSTVQW